MKRVLAIWMVGAALVLGRGAWAADAPGSLIVNGDFETDKDADGAPDGWPKAGGGLSWEKEGDNHFMRLKVAEAGKMVMVYRSIVLKPEIKTLELSYRVRFDGIKIGAQVWFDGRIMMNFRDGDKKEVKPGPRPPNFKGTQKEWQTRTQKISVPEGAKTLEVMFTLFNAEAGTLDFDDIKLVPVEAEAKPETKPEGKPETKPEGKSGAAGG